MASADHRDELTCSNCANIYTDPVTLQSGQSFCRLCVGETPETWKGSKGYKRPESRVEVQPFLALEKNRNLCNIEESFRSAPPEQEEVSVPCTYCDLPVPAAKTCLMCEASLCEKHLKKHSTSPEHVLTEPTTSLENRKCSVHKKVLEYYCCEDTTCICVSCSLTGEHRGHQVETLNEASEKKKEKLRNILEKLTSEREEAEKSVQSLEELERQVQGKAAGVTEQITALIRDIREQLEALEKQVLREISRQEEQVSLRVSDLIQNLEIWMEKLSRKMGHIEELCNMMDPLIVIQGRESDRVDYCDTQEDNIVDTQRRDIRVHDIGDLDIGLISVTLHSGLAGIVTGVTRQRCVPKAVDMLLGVNTASDMLLDVNTTSDIILDVNTTSDMMLLDVSTASDMMLLDVNTASDMLLDVNTASDMLLDVNTASDMLLDVNTASDMLLDVNTASDMLLDVNTASDMLLDVNTASDMLLDVNTAGNDVFVSGDLKTVSWAKINRCLQETPERFQDYPQVLSASSFSSGQHYWEVEGNESGGWGVGMTYPSIDRRGYQSGIGFNNKSWVLGRGNIQYYVRHDSNVIRLPHHPASWRLGIFLDYEAGRLSFYELCDPIRHLHTYIVDFTEPLHAGFSVYRDNSWLRI